MDFLIRVVTVEVVVVWNIVVAVGGGVVLLIVLINHVDARKRK